METSINTTWSITISHTSVTVHARALRGTLAAHAAAASCERVQVPHVLLQPPSQLLLADMHPYCSDSTIASLIYLHTAFIVPSPQESSVFSVQDDAPNFIKRNKMNISPLKSAKYVLPKDPCRCEKCLAKLAAQSRSAHEKAGRRIQSHPLFDAEDKVRSAPAASGSRSSGAVEAAAHKPCPLPQDMPAAPAPVPPLRALGLPAFRADEGSRAIARCAARVYWAWMKA